MASRNTVLALILSSVICVDVQADLTGDPEAIELADQLVESIGGKELWTKIHSLHVFEQSRSLRGDGIVGEFWRDLRTPRERYTLRNRSGLNIEFGWDDRGVWQIVDGRRNEELPASLHDEVKAYWHGEIYVMYHRLAKGDSELRLEKNEDNSFTVFDQVLDRRLGTFWINADGELYRWRHDDGTEYVYGPHRKFGQISFPDWGTQVDGSWSFYYVDVRWSTDEPSVSFDPPDG